MAFKLSVSIMAVPQRRLLVNSMLKGLPDKTPVSYDLKRRGIWENAKLAWMSYDRSASHHLLLQDDLELCDGFMDVSLKLVEVFPEAIIGLYHNRMQATQEAKNKGLNWIKFNVVNNACANIMPTAWIPEFVYWCEKHVEPNYRHDDGRLCLWQLHGNRKAECYFTAPTVVEHLMPSDSSAHNNNRNRVSGWFDKRLPAQIDWAATKDKPLRKHIGVMDSTKDAYVP